MFCIFRTEQRIGNNALVINEVLMTSRKLLYMSERTDREVVGSYVCFLFSLLFLFWCALMLLSPLSQMLSFFQGMFTFYHQGHELSKDFNHYKMELQINIQNVRKRKPLAFKRCLGCASVCLLSAKLQDQAGTEKVGICCHQVVRSWYNNLLFS